MSQQTERHTHQVGVFLNPAGERREGFQAACGERFGRLLLADSAAQAASLLAQQPVDLLVIDLDRFDRGIDLDAIGQLVTQRAGAPVLVICPFTVASWLPQLMAFGPIEYAIGPLLDAQLGQLVGARGAAASAPVAPTPAEQQLRELLGVGARVQQALADNADAHGLAGQICQALCSWPGVVHAGLFRLDETGRLRLEAQHALRGLNLESIVGGGDQLAQSPLRHAFPGLLAAFSGELAFLDAPEKAGDPELAVTLRAHGVSMVAGVPIPADAPGAARGALCLMFEHGQRLSAEQLAALDGFARLAGFGLRMAELSGESRQLASRLTHLATVDALTGVANRRRGEELLAYEIRRARRYQLPLTLITFDIDHFNAVNKRFGHPCGDVALRTLTEVTQGALRTTDMLVRSGGEEFQIIAPHTTAVDGLKMAEKIRVAISETPIPGCDRLTVSIGVSQLSGDESADALIVRADAALARAKRAGRNCVELAML